MIGSQINMVSQSWDGERVYFSSSLLGNWDKTADADEQFVKLYHWNGESLDHQWTVDFYAEGLGRAHQMRFGAYAMYGKQRPDSYETKFALTGTRLGGTQLRSPRPGQLHATGNQGRCQW